MFGIWSVSEKGFFFLLFLKKCVHVSCVKHLHFNQEYPDLDLNCPDKYVGTGKKHKKIDKYVKHLHSTQEYPNLDLNCPAKHVGTGKKHQKHW